jgi:ABC-2 type transport system permease protein
MAFGPAGLSREGERVDQLLAVMYREAKIRATNLTFIFWDLVYPLGYLLLFGVAMSRAIAFTVPGAPADYNAFFLGGVLAMASFGIAANTSWSFFVDRDNGIFYEMLTYPLTRGQYLLGKVLFNVLVALAQALITIGLAAVLLGVPVRPVGLPLVLAAVVVGPAGWFFFYAIFALRIRRNDAFNTVTSIFYFVFLFASTMFYPLEALPGGFRLAALANPVTWQVDAFRYGTIGMGDGTTIAWEAAAYLGFTLVSFWLAARAISKE